MSQLNFIQIYIYIYIYTRKGFSSKKNSTWHDAQNPSVSNLLQNCASWLIGSGPSIAHNVKNMSRDLCNKVGETGGKNSVGEGQGISQPDQRNVIAWKVIASMVDDL